MTATLTQHTYLPAADQDLARVYDFLAAHSERHGATVEPTYALIGSGPGERVEVPREIHEVLLHVVQALQAGKAVTVAPMSTRLTTQQAADLLMISRPTLVKLLEDGLIPHERNSSRRMVLLADVLAYRDRRRAEQYAALEATSVPLDDEDDLQEALAQMREARAAVGARRRN
ncbi:MAG: helix-turn-helix domain-containing protein [Actinotalea sp.]|nr:helix-turn-helix domain-containing protein [Actinotalea sp.]